MKPRSVSFQDIKEQWQYIFDERLGIMCEGAEPTPEQVAIATKEADEAARRLKDYLETVK